MSSTQIVVMLAAILAIAALALAAVRLNRRRGLRRRFGPEYDRAVAERNSRVAAERDLLERERRHAKLEIKPLSPDSRARYAAAWEEVQVRFVYSPSQAVGTADQLVTDLIAERGYPTVDYDERLALLSVEHARTLGHYRDAHRISRRNAEGLASTEDLRQALVHYRNLFADLLGADPVRTDTPDRHHDGSNGSRPAEPH